MSIRVGLLLAVVTGAGCSATGGPPKFEGPPVRVVATTTLVADLARKVGGDRVTVDTLMGPGADPHRYLPTPDDLRKLKAAHLVMHNGLHLEGKMTDTFEKNGDRIRAAAVTRMLNHDTELRKADFDAGGEHDPHVWFDVLLWAKAVDAVRDDLTALDPGGADLYRANAAAYRGELEKLDAEVKATLAKVPAGRRILVTSHDAFGYFGRAYGFEVVGLQGVSTAAEVNINERAKLARLLGEKKIPAVFTETSVPDTGLKSVLDTAKRDFGHAVTLVGGDDALYSDALGGPGSPGETYPGMIRHNAAVIVKALAP